MISSINFKGRYNFPEWLNTSDKQEQIKNYVTSNPSYQSSVIRYRNTNTGETKYTTIAVVPDKENQTIESYCLQNGIKFSKFKGDDEFPAISVRGVYDKIKAPEKNKVIAFVHTKKLEELTKNQFTNIDHCASDYARHYYKDVKRMMTEDNEFPLTSLYITPNCMNKEELIEYIDRFGANNLNDEELFIDFSQRTNNPDHCTYFALNNIGLEYVLFYVDNDTYEIGEKLGILY